jgi:hypothetical protein
MDFNVAVVIRPSSRNLFMKALTRDRVVPIISASVSWLIFASALNVENRIRKVALRVHNLILPVVGYGSPTIHFRQTR